MKFFNLTELVRVRRWKRSEIARLLGKPDRIVPGIHQQPAHLYDATRVLLAEQQYSPFRAPGTKEQGI